MALLPAKKAKIKDILKQSIINKFNKYKPESSNMPFHYRLLGKDRMALYSFIQSLNTTFGTSIYEPVVKELARDNFLCVETQAHPYNVIYSDAQVKIQQIINDLSTSIREPNKEQELLEISKVNKSGTLNKVKLTKIDILLQSKSNELFLIDMKTVKPNIGELKGLKRTMLEWASTEMIRNPLSSIHTMIAIPYNPYEPEPYERWTMKGIFDVPNEVLIAEELWDFVGGKGTYDELLDCFEIAGIELRPEIDAYFNKFK